MGSHAIVTVRCCPDEQMLFRFWSSIKSNWNNHDHLRCNMSTRTIRPGHDSKLTLNPISNSNSSHYHQLWRIYTAPVCFEQSSSSSVVKDELTYSTESEDETLSKPISNDKLKSLLVDSERTKLVKKLSESNQQNRFLKRQLQANENSVVAFKKELAVIEQEMKALVSLADEIAKTAIPKGTTRINGKYIHTHLLSRLEALRGKIQEQIKDVEAAQSKEVHVFWIGMAESVQVMGSFDGWSQGEHLSPEYTGSFTKFFTTLLLRPGRYEVKFLVDGEWQLSSEFPTTGEGPTENNLLVVE